MRKTLTLTVVLAAALAPATAFADKPTDKGNGKDKDKVKPYCVPQTVGFKASGTLVSTSLTQTAGADTPKRGDDRYSGEVVVNVAKANHKGATGEQAFTLTDGRVKFHPSKDTEATAGDRVKLSGKTTKYGKKCTETSAPAPTVKKVDVKAKRS